MARANSSFPVPVSPADQDASIAPGDPRQSLDLPPECGAFPDDSRSTGESGTRMFRKATWVPVERTPDARQDFAKPQRREDEIRRSGSQQRQDVVLPALRDQRDHGRWRSQFVGDFYDGSRFLEGIPAQEQQDDVRLERGDRRPCVSHSSHEAHLDIHAVL
jgi:hypothetical protein